MSLENIVRSVAGRLSLRAPQAESLERLHNAIESVPASVIKERLAGRELDMLFGGPPCQQFSKSG